MSGSITKAMRAAGRPLVLGLSIAWALAGVAPAGEPRLEVELEGGPVWQTKNDLQIPNEEPATRFSLVDLVGNGPFPSGRLTVTWNFADRHGLRGIASPLRLVESGIPLNEVNFAGKTFPAGDPVEATYQFNSWRLAYRYLVRAGNRSRWWIGFTAKVRDAKVALSAPGRTGTDTDVGFVPLMHLAGHLDLSARARLRVDVDGLAGGPGRAVDASARVAYDVQEAWGVAAGYRTLEGGADVDSVYSFAWLHYAVASVYWRLGA